MSSARLASGASVFLRLALAASFFSAVADRLGLWGAPGQPNVAWGDFPQFVAYTAKLNWFLPAATVLPLAVVATVLETTLGFLLLIGWRTRIAALLSGVLLLSFGISMMLTLGVKAPLNFSVFSAAGGSLALACSERFSFSIDAAMESSIEGTTALVDDAARNVRRIARNECPGSAAKES